MSEANGCPTLEIEAVPSGRNGAAVLTARLGGDILAHEKVDLSKPEKRDAFRARLEKDRPGLNGPALDKQLLRMAADLARPADESNEPARPTNDDLLARMPEHVRQDARAMLESPDLMRRVLADAERIGIAGERELVATIFLVSISRLLPSPLGAIVQAPSSTGKTYVVERVATFTPPEGKIIATQMTPQSLYFMKPGSLSHRIIIAGERSRKEDDDTAEATRALREMRSSGKLSKLIPVKIGGEIETRLIEQDGPIAYVETTTLTSIFAEDSNRNLLLAADERVEQTRRVVDSLAAAYSGGQAPAAIGLILQRHHAAQRMLQQRPVIVPYAGVIAEHFDCERVEARRAFPHLVGMIQASALLHQLQRQIDSDGRIIANADDYRLARSLCTVPLSRLLGGSISGAAVRFYGRLASWVQDVFNTGDAARRDQKSSQNVRGWLRELAEAGAVEQVEPSKGNRPAVWKLTGMDIRELETSGCYLPESVG